MSEPLLINVLQWQAVVSAINLLQNLLLFIFLPFTADFYLSQLVRTHRTSPFGSAAMEDPEAPASSERRYLQYVTYFL